MNALRLAELVRQRAALFEQLAVVERTIADELTSEAEAAPAPAPAETPRLVVVRESYEPEPREIPTLARARANRVMAKLRR